MIIRLPNKEKKPSDPGNEATIIIPANGMLIFRLNYGVNYIVEIKMHVQSRGPVNAGLVMRHVIM